ncbi:major facilitator superfamily domain-containing protein [Parachaetomium inaequale]|uniref:Major facilitator superfamily domain-containing protein n=1 Tax=Parachaetomium inaequale TaxID=2588326 RepID=A0AAN6PNT4_9PEZI|nr:major facilitator superfamily domain-containing protein [Parachaetomium inaequale]
MHYDQLFPRCCPVQTSDRFTKFQRLPPEIRNMIWEFALPEPRVYEVLDAPNAKQKTPAQEGLMFANVHPEPPPALAAVCRESRYFVLHHYKPLTLGKTTKFVDVSRDILLLEPYLLVKRLHRTLHFMSQIPLVRDNATRLALGTSYGIYPGIFHPVLGRKVSKNNMGKLLASLAKFPRLRTLIFVVHQEFQFDKQHIDLPLAAFLLTTPALPNPPPTPATATTTPSTIPATTTPATTITTTTTTTAAAALLYYPLLSENAREARDEFDEYEADGEEEGEWCDPWPTNDDWRRFRRRWVRGMVAACLPAVGAAGERNGEGEEGREVVRGGKGCENWGEKGAAAKGAGQRICLPKWKLKGASLLWRYTRGAGGAATEQTPLLAAGDVAPNNEAVEHAQDEANGGNQDRNSEDRNVDDRPLPVWQIAALCYARWVEPVAFFSIFPYINQMAQENGRLADTDMGFYSGLIESLFSLTQMFVMIAWGRAADRFGRKPVLLLSLVGVSCATALFGMARTIWEMILFRCLAGVFAGSIVTIRTMISEHSTSKTQARAFSWFAFTGNMGILFGPLIGGTLADPARLYPGLFGNVRFFLDYPYALPSLTVGVLGLSAVVVTAVCVEETLPKLAAAAGSHNEESGAPKPDAYSTRDLLKSPGVPAVLYAYGHIMMLAYSYTAIVPVFWVTKVRLGGFGFTSLEISLMMGLNGLAQATWILLVFPPLHNRIGTNGVLKACAIAYPLFFAVCPFLNFLLRLDSPTSTTAFWIAAPVLLALGCGVSMSFTAIQLALNDASPSPTTLGTLNALALSIVSGVRAFSPALFAGLFAVGARTQLLWGYAIWVLMVLIALGFTVLSRFMPDYDEMKRRREREGGR